MIAKSKERARHNGVSLQKQTKRILGKAAKQFSPEEARARSDEWHRRLGGHKFGDSTALIREDRRR